MTDTKTPATKPSPEPGKLTPQNQGPGQGMAAGSGYRMGPTQDEIESPVQKARDKREDLETSKVDSGGTKIWDRRGEPASIEERKAAGDKVPAGDDPDKPGVPGQFPPGSSKKAADEKEAAEAKTKG